MTESVAPSSFLSTRTMLDVDEYTRSAVDAYIALASRALVELDLPPPELFVLYGSRARGDHDSASDADFALVLQYDQDLSPAQILWDVGAKTYSAEAEFSFLVAPIVIWSKYLSQPRTSKKLFLLRERTEGRNRMDCVD